MPPEISVAVDAGFETYVEAMQPWVRKIVRKRVKPHPFLSDDDLAQEALFALLQVWRRYGATHVTDEVRRIGTSAVVRRMHDVWSAAGNGHAHEVVVQSDNVVREDDVVVLDIPVLPVALESILLREATDIATDVIGGSEDFRATMSSGLMRTARFKRALQDTIADLLRNRADIVPER